MKRLFLRKIGLGVLLIGACASHGVGQSADDAVTLVLKSGERLESVEYRVLRDLHVIEVSGPDGKRNIDLGAIDAVVTASGDTITSRIVGTTRSMAPTPSPVPAEEGGIGAPPPTSPWPSENSPVLREARRRRWAGVLALTPTGVLPFGDYYRGTDGGLGVDAVYHLAVSSEIAVRLSAGLFGLDASDDLPLISDDPELEIVSGKQDLDARRYLVGLEYYQPLGEQSPPLGFWFLHSSLGAIEHWTSATVVLRNRSTGERARGTGHDTDTKFVTSGGVGTVLAMGKHLGLEIGANVDAVWMTVRSYAGSDSYGAKGWIASLHVGLGAVL